MRVTRLAMALGAIAAFVTAAAAPVSPPTTADPDGVMVLGFSRARVTVTEYASVGCPHCAHWAKTVYPAFKAKYIDTGRVKFAFHEMLTGDGALAAAGFLLAHCAGAPKYFQVVDQVFAKQNEIAAQGAPALMVVAQSVGSSPKTAFNACLSDERGAQGPGRTHRGRRHGPPRPAARRPSSSMAFRLDGRRVAAKSFDVAIARARRH